VAYNNPAKRRRTLQSLPYEPERLIGTTRKPTPIARVQETFIAALNGAAFVTFQLQHFSTGATTMREYSIVLPTHDNDGISLATLHNSLKRELIDQFDGYSATAQTGGWLNAEGELFEEPSIRYTVCAQLWRDVFGLIKNIAKKYGILGNQQAMYVVLDGTVEIITIGA
jgi:hypothetical protein